MAHFRSIFYLMGWLLLILSASMVPPAIFDFVENVADYKAYLLSASITVFLGVLLVFSNKSGKEIEFDKKDSFLFTTLSWIMAIGFSSLPFLFSSLSLSWTDAVFETVSGLTTTGATVLKNLDTLSKGILFWRATLQWLGGIGIVVMALTFLADMRIGGMELFQSESSDRSEKFLPRMAQITKVILLTYVLLTCLCFLALRGAGMSWFDAICHSFSTVSTGGFSTHDKSIEYFNSSFIECILVVFMFLGGSTQLLFGHFFGKNWRTFFQDQQFQAYCRIVLSAILLIVIWNFLTLNESPGTILTKSTFNVVSAITTTGFESADYNRWGSFPIIVFFFIPFIGGCTGSTSGGIKVFRFEVLWEIILIHLQKLRRPHGIFLPKYKARKISDSVFDSVATFFVLFVFCFALLCLALSCLGLDFLTTLSTAGAMLTNLGPGLGDVVGPTKTYSTLAVPVKWVLMFGMLLGRLELLTILVLFVPSFWRD